LINQLKQQDKHFEKLFSQHNDLDQRIQNAVNGIDRCSVVELENMKKEKLRLKDSLYSILLSKSGSAPA
jgi:uncharacterized protein YdcH (DUF465 family)